MSREGNEAPEPAAKIGELGVLSRPVVLWSFTTLAILLLLFSCLHLFVQAQVNAQMGFAYATPWEGRREVFIITRVKPGGPMAVAGLRRDDYVLFDSVPRLYDTLIANQGKEIPLPIRRGSDLLTLRVAVPVMRAPFSGGVLDALYWPERMRSRIPTLRPEG